MCECVIIRVNVTYESFRVLEYLKQYTNIRRSCYTINQQNKIVKTTKAVEHSSVIPQWCAGSTCTGGTWRRVSCLFSNPTFSTDSVNWAPYFVQPVHELRVVSTSQATHPRLLFPWQLCFFSAVKIFLLTLMSG